MVKFKKQGFTLVELLVVLVIIGILAAVAVPLYLQHTKRARISEAVATMGLIRQAERDYKVNHNAFFDVARDSGKSNTSGNIRLPLPTSVVQTTGVPTPNPSGLDIAPGVVQYFYGGTFYVDADSTPATVSGLSRSGLYGTGGTPDAQDFIIHMRADDNYKCAAAGDTNCALHFDDVSTAPDSYEAEMDNSGRIFVCYKSCATPANWSAY